MEAMPVDGFECVVSLAIQTLLRGMIAVIVTNQTSTSGERKSVESKCRDQKNLKLRNHFTDKLSRSFGASSP